MSEPIFSIGHSNHDFDDFASLLHGAGVTAVADVRTQPWSRYRPAFRRDALKTSLEAAGLAYVWLGDSLGGRPRDPALLSNGRPDHAKIASSPSFRAGLDRLIAGSAKHRIAMMCAEQHPLNCHRCRLLGRNLLRRDVDTRHILPDGGQLLQSVLEDALQASLSPAQHDLFGGEH